MRYGGFFPLIESVLYITAVMILTFSSTFSRSIIVPAPAVLWIRETTSMTMTLVFSVYQRTRWFRRLPATNVSDTDLDENRRNIGQILPLLEASVAGNGEVEALVANLQKVGWMSLLAVVRYINAFFFHH